MSYTIELSNGKVFTGLSLSGTCYVSKTAVKESDFAGGLRSVKVTLNGEGEAAGMKVEQTLEYAELGGVFTVDGGYYFWFVERSAEEKALMKLQADTEYVAMMTGVEL